jgi:hypothetical protein
MSEPQRNNGEDAIDESGRNLTQQEIDERGASGAPADEDWTESPAERPDSAVGGGEAA